MTADILIQPPRLTDVSALSSLARRVFVNTYGRAIPNEVLVRYLEKAFSIEQLSADAQDKDAQILLAWQQDTLAGFSRLEPNAPPAPVSSESAIELSKLYVADEFQRQGVGTKLMEHSIGRAIRLGYKFLWLFVWEQNARAIAFYKKCGFDAVGSHDLYIGEALFKDLVMQKRLM